MKNTKKLFSMKNYCSFHTTTNKLSIFFLFYYFFYFWQIFKMKFFVCKQEHELNRLNYRKQMFVEKWTDVIENFNLFFSLDYFKVFRFSPILIQFFSNFKVNSTMKNSCHLKNSIKIIHNCLLRLINIEWERKIIKKTSCKIF